VTPDEMTRHTEDYLARTDVYEVAHDPEEVARRAFRAALELMNAPKAPTETQVARFILAYGHPRALSPRQVKLGLIAVEAAR
jgi:predicted Zn-dependent protease